MVGKCPACEGSITTLSYRAVDAKSGRRAIKAITFNCPLCDAVLGAQADPLAMVGETLAGVEKIVKGKDWRR